MYNDYLDIRANLMSKKIDYAMATVIKTSGSSIAKPGFKILISGNKIMGGTFGSRKMDNIVMKEAMKCIEEKKAEMITIGLDKFNKNYDFNMDTACGGSIDIFIEPTLNNVNILVLVEADNDEIFIGMKKLSEFLNINLTQINTENDNVIETIRTMDLTDSYIVLLTKNDREIGYLKEILKKPSKYIGLVASVNRFKHDLESLKETCNDNDLKRIKCPAGIEINAISPEEISLSVISELILFKNKGYKKELQIKEASI